MLRSIARGVGALLLGQSGGGALAGERSLVVAQQRWLPGSTMPPRPATAGNNNTTRRTPAPPPGNNGAARALASAAAHPEISVYSGPSPPRKAVTLRTLRAKYARGEPITMVTAYDYPSAVHVRWRFFVWRRGEGEGPRGARRRQQEATKKR